MKKFISPQTGSVYNVFVEVGNFKICFRKIDKRYRVRIQGDKYNLSSLNLLWGEVKDGDHLSVVVYEYDLIKTLCTALRAVLEKVGLKDGLKELKI